MLHEHFQLIFDNSNVNSDKQIKQKMANFFSANFSELSKFFFLILRREVTLESKVVATKRNSSAFLLHASKTFSNVKVISIFSQTFLELIFTSKIKTMLLNNHSAVLFTSFQKNIAYIMCLNT